MTCRRHVQKPAPEQIDAVVGWQGKRRRELVEESGESGPAGQDSPRRGLGEGQYVAKENLFAKLLQRDHASIPALRCERCS